MNEELTNEVLEALRDCEGAGFIDCAECLATKICESTDTTVCNWLAAALLEERAKPKDDVWKYASDGTTTADVYYGNSVLVSATPDYTFTRELPKTRIDEIVKETREKIRDYLFAKDGQETIVIDEILKSALKKYAEELEKK